MTVGNLALGGNTLMEINKSLTPSNDLVVASSEAIFTTCQSVARSP